MITKSLLNTKSPKSSHFEKDMFNNTNFKINDVTDIQVRIKSDKHDDWIKELKIQVLTVNGIINICISDNDDPCFLYKVGISESDFHSIKQAQNFLIDFQQFPNKILEMLELCKENDLSQQNNNNISIMKGTSSFHCILEEKQNSEALLLIQEISQFKCSDYLRLILKTPNDSLLKRHISSLCLEYKKKYETSSEESYQLKKGLEILESKYNTVSEENKNLIIKKEIELKNNELTNEKIIIEKESRHREEVNRLTSEYNNKLSELMNNHKIYVNKLDDKINELSVQNNSLKEVCSNFQTEIKDLTVIKEKIIKENSKLIIDIDELRTENKELCGIRYQNDKQITELSFRLNSILENTGEKDQNNKTLHNLVDTLHNTISELESKNKSLKEKLELSCSEIDKANKIIEQKNLKINKQKQTLEQRQNSLRNQNTTITQLNSQVLEEKKKYDQILNEKIRIEDQASILKSSLEEETKKYEKLLEQKEQTEGALRYISQKYNENNAPLATLLGNNNGYKSKEVEINFKDTSNSFNITKKNDIPLPIKEEKSEFILPYTQFSKNKYQSQPVNVESKSII